MESKFYEKKIVDLNIDFTSSTDLFSYIYKKKKKKKKKK